jgi:hypothetical protein
MISVRRAVGLIAAIVIAIASLEVASVFTPGLSGFVTPAEAVVGRPLTPVSVAGVARRTVRRCAVGVYYC